MNSTKKTKHTLRPAPKYASHGPSRASGLQQSDPVRDSAELPVRCKGNSKGNPNCFCARCIYMYGKISTTTTAQKRLFRIRTLPSGLSDLRWTCGLSFVYTPPCRSKNFLNHPVVHACSTVTPLGRAYRRRARTPGRQPRWPAHHLSHGISSGLSSSFSVAALSLPVTPLLRPLDASLHC